MAAEARSHRSPVRRGPPVAVCAHWASASTMLISASPPGGSWPSAHGRGLRGRCFDPMDGTRQWWSSSIVAAAHIADKIDGRLAVGHRASARKRCSASSWLRRHRGLLPSQHRLGLLEEWSSASPAAFVAGYAITLVVRGASDMQAWLRPNRPGRRSPSTAAPAARGLSASRENQLPMTGGDDAAVPSHWPPGPRSSHVGEPGHAPAKVGADRCQSRAPLRSGSWTLRRATFGRYQFS